MKLCVPAVHDLTAEILSYSYLFECLFLLPDCDSALCESGNDFFVAVLNAHLSFGVDDASGHSGKTCPGFPHK